MKFSTRDLIWLTVVVALAVGWANERGKLLAKLRRPGNVTVDISGTMQELRPG